LSVFSQVSNENENHKDKMGVFAPGRSTDVDRCVEETETLLRNTRSFLDGLREADEQTRQYVKELTETLERDMQRLRIKKEGK